MHLGPEHIRFLVLHAKHHVVKWHWHFQETQLRAYTEAGRTATASRKAVEELVAWGLMTCGAGHAKYVTERGVAAVEGTV